MDNEKAWDYAIGIVQVDGIKPSDDFLELAEKEKRGEITGEDIRGILLAKHTVLEYKGYHGSIEYSSSDNIFFGKVTGLNSLISYEGNSIESLRKDFEGAIDDYFEMCAPKGIEPETPINDMLEYKGYSGTVEYSAADKTLFGKVIGVTGYLSYVGDSLESLRKNFEDMIDDYLETCTKDGVEPQTPMRDKK